jgi:hypothetical protein
MLINIFIIRKHNGRSDNNFYFTPMVLYEDGNTQEIRHPLIEVQTMNADRFIIPTSTSYV